MSLIEPQLKRKLKKREENRLKLLKNKCGTTKNDHKLHICTNVFISFEIGLSNEDPQDDSGNKDENDHNSKLLMIMS